MNQSKAVVTLSRFAPDLAPDGHGSRSSANRGLSGRSGVTLGKKTSVFTHSVDLRWTPGHWKITRRFITIDPRWRHGESRYRPGGAPVVHGGVTAWQGCPRMCAGTSRCRHGLTRQSHDGPRRSHGYCRYVPIGPGKQWRPYLFNNIIHENINWNCLDPHLLHK